MPHVIAWRGFLGARLPVAGPFDQAVREVGTTRLRYHGGQDRPAIDG
jgi:hypothetical protein